MPKPINKLTGQAEFNGTSILDVTDPANPKYLKHIPGLEGNYEDGGGQMVRVCDGATLPNADKAKTYMLRVFGGQRHEVWDVTDPANPALLATIGDGLKDTHKNWWECDTGIAYLVSGAPGWRTRRMMQVYDLSDPAHPKFIRDFGMVGQQPGTEGAVPTELHGAISTGPKGNRVYVGYGTNKGGVLQILDREKLLNGPKEPTPENLRVSGDRRVADVAAGRRAHHLSARRGRDPGVCRRQVRRQAQHDHDRRRGAGERMRRRRVAPDGVVRRCHHREVTRWWYRASRLTAGNFCERGGRFGSHSSNESMAPVFYGKLAFVTWFNAGVRAIDIRNPYRPKEVGYFIPPITEATDKRCVKVDGKDQCKTAIQSNNVETDDRGYIYVVDRANTGLHILEVTGEARADRGDEVTFLLSPRPA